MRIVVAMSGGVDSSVAAALLVEAGHEVIGLSMQLYDQSGGDTRFGGCCTLDDLHDARRVAAKLGIPHYIVNFERRFEREVISNFIDEYLEGRTPIPCTRCNSELKFSTLLDRALALGADAIATGHYARVGRDEATGRYRVLRSADRQKDQTYFLFGLTQDQLARTLFPLGDLEKREVRAIAARRGLAVHDKRDSHEICFIPDNDHARFIEARTDAAAREGLITDSNGRPLGRHGGIHRFTVGQRKGLGLSSDAPLYVLELRPAERRVIVGRREELEKRTLVAREVHWIAGAPPGGPLRVSAQIRYRHRDAPATVTPLDGERAWLAFDEPQLAIAPGQAVVFYVGDELVGGGWIERAGGEHPEETSSPAAASEPGACAAAR